MHGCHRDGVCASIMMVLLLPVGSFSQQFIISSQSDERFLHLLIACTATHLFVWVSSLYNFLWMMLFVGMIEVVNVVVF